MRKGIFAVLAIVLMIGTFLQPLPVSAADPEPGEMAPANPEFESFVRGLQVKPSSGISPNQFT